MAFAISVKMEPSEFYKVCKDYCYNNISLQSFTGQLGGWGPTDVEFEAMFPTGPDVLMPQMGFAYGVPVEAFPVQTAVPVVALGGGGVPTAVPMTAVPTATPVFTALPTATSVPLQTPAIGAATSYDPVPMATVAGEQGYSVTQQTTTTATWLAPAGQQQAAPAQGAVPMAQAQYA